MTTRDDQNQLRDLGATIRRCREATGLTQAELAGRAVIDRSYLCGIESGKRSPTVLVLMRIAQVWAHLRPRCSTAARPSH